MNAESNYGDRRDVVRVLKSGGTPRFAQTANSVSIDGNSIAGGGSETAWLVFDRLTAYDQNRTPPIRTRY